MLSRVADSIYWMCRYIERAENVARFVDVNLHLMLDLPDDAGRQWQPLVAVTGDKDVFAGRYNEPTEANVRQFLTFDADNPNSIISCIDAARLNARSVREIISSEMWEQINSLYLRLHDPGAGAQADSDPHAFYESIKTASHLFTGIMETTMSHNDGWHFGRLGRLLERADKTSRILDVKYFLLLPEASEVGSPYDNIQWAALLKSASAFEMYRKTYSAITPANVVSFLALDRQFPRTMRYCLANAEYSLHEITGTQGRSFANTAEQQLGRLRSELDYVAVDEMISGGLHEYLDAFQSKLNRVCDAVFETFFARRPPQSQA